MTSFPDGPTTLPLLPDLPLTLTQAGRGQPVLLLHGGGGPLTVSGLADHLATFTHTLTPTHPGWNGTPRPDRLARVHDLARTYLQLLEHLDLSGVVLVGSSLGGWIAAEMALHERSGRVGGLILIDAVGVEVRGEPIRDVFALSPREVAGLSFHDPQRFFVDPASFPVEQRARQAANMATMRVLAGEPYMHDPTLLTRLDAVHLPALVLWGEQDRVVTPAYGAAYAAAIRSAQFAVISGAGHLPQLEQPETTFALIDGFLNGQANPAELSNQR